MFHDDPQNLAAHGIPTGAVPRMPRTREEMIPSVDKVRAMHEEAIRQAVAPMIRAFATGATRSADAGRYDPEAFLSPIVIERFSEYMQKNRVQPDGSIRAGDNWQKGIPKEDYLKGMWRHFLHLWTRLRGFQVQDKDAAANIEEDLCALMFGVQGLLFEVLKDQRRALPSITITKDVA